MDSSPRPDIVPAPAHFAKSDTAEGEALKRRITACLKDRFRDLQDVHVAVFGTSVALRGKVSSTGDKRLCLECCRNFPGVTKVVDELIVVEGV